MRKYLLVAIIASFLLLALLPSCVDAATVPDNPEDTTVAEIADTDTMVNNHGTITVNNGIIQNNYGTVVENNGVILNNHDTVTENNGTVINNYSLVTTNEGRVENSLGSSEVTTNHGTIINLHGSINTNGDGSGNGTVIFMRGGDINVNNDNVYYMFENTGGDPSAVTTNNGTIYSAVNSEIGTNYGTIVRLGPGSIIGSGSDPTSDYSDTTGLWVGDTLITNETKSGPGWTFNSNTFTLRLEDSNITTSTSRNNGFIDHYDSNMVNSNAIIYNGTGKMLNISVVGTNTISGDSVAYGIYSEGGVNIAGTGSLSINVSQEDSVGIRSLGNIRTTSGTITSSSDIHAIWTDFGKIDFDGGTITASATDTMEGFSVWAGSNDVSMTEGTLNIRDIDMNGNLTMSGGTINVTQLIGVTGNPYIPGKFTMTGGTINTTSRAVNDVMMYASEFDVDPAAVLTNLTLDGGCYKVTAAGNASISFPVEGYEVTFDANGGTVTPTSDTTNAQNKLDSLPTPEYEGHLFLGWFDDTSAGTQITTDTVFDANTTIYAHWVTTYTVTFNATGGTVTPTSATTNAQSKLTSLPEPIYANHTFFAWFDALGNQVDTNKVYNQNTTLYARWTVADNAAENTLEVLTEYEIMVNNYGTIQQLYGTLTNNTGAVSEMNNGLVTNNTGTIEWMYGGTVTTNASTGMIDCMYGGNVTTNSGTIDYQSYGVIANNDSNGIITCVDATQYQQGTVTANAGSIVYNYGTVTANSGTVTDNYGTVTSNSGTITRNWGTVTNNTGTITTQYYRVTMVNNNSATVIGGTLDYDTLYLQSSSTATLVPSAGYSFSETPTATGCTLTMIAEDRYSITNVTGPVSITAATTSNSEALFWVGGTAVAGTSSGEGWSYNADSNTLTLNAAEFSYFHYGAVKDINNNDQMYRAVIFDGRDTGLNLELQGHSVLAYDTLGLQYAIYTKGDLTISGTGSIHAATSMKSGAGIWSAGKITINGGSINADGCTVGFGSVGNITINGGEVYTSSERGSQCIFTPTGSVTITGGSVYTVANHGFDIWVASNNFSMSGGTLNLAGSGCLDVNGTVTISGGTIYSTGDASYVIGVFGSGPSGSKVFSMTGGIVIVNNAKADSIFILTGSFDLGQGVNLTNLTPKKYDEGQSKYVVCDIGEATRLYATAAGKVSIGIGQTGFTVTFDANGGTGSMTPVTNVTGEYTLPQNGFTAPEGKTFKCWSVGGVDKQPANVIIVGEDTLVTAVWESSPGPAPTYTVSFNANGGTGSMADVTGISGTYTLPNNAFTAPSGKEFKCWSITIGSAEAIEKDPQQTISVTANTSVTAVWKDIPAQTYTVSYNANGGTGSMADVTDVSGEYTLLSNGFTAPSGKIFRCWTVGEVEKYPGDKINVTANTIVKAVWKDAPAPEPAYTVDTEGSKKIYSNEVTAGTDTDVSGIFTTAKANSGDVEVKSGNLTIAFDSAAVSEIGGNTVSLKAEVKTTGLDVENAKAVIEVTLDGSSFSDGKATLTVPFIEEVPSGKTLKVYYVNGTEKTEITGAIYQDGKVVFSTSHFSKYAIVFEDASSPSGSGFPIWIVVVIIVVVIAAVGAFVFLKKSGKI